MSTWILFLKMVDFIGILVFKAVVSFFFRKPFNIEKTHRIEVSMVIYYEKVK